MNATKQLALACKAAGNGQPDTSELATIRQYHLREFAPDQLYVRTVVLAHNGIDRDNEVFDEDFLKTLARTLKGKGLFEIHPLGWDGSTGMPEGLWFDAYVETMSFGDARTLLREPGLQFPPDRQQATVLFGKFYAPVMAANEEMRTKVDAGLGFASIGFSATRRDPVKDSAGRELEARRIGGDGEALEASLVWLGAQQGARAVKSATNRGDTVDLKALLTALAAVFGLTPEATADQVIEGAKSLKAAQSGTPDARIGKFDAVKSALGDDGAMLDDPAKLKACVADGKSFRTTLIDEMVANDRATGRIKADSDAEVTAYKSHFVGLPTEALKALHAGSAKGVKTGGSLGASDPNAADPTGKAAGDKRPPALDTPLL